MALDGGVASTGYRLAGKRKAGTGPPGPAGTTTHVPLSQAIDAEPGEEVGTVSKPTHEDATLMLQLVQTWPVDVTNWIWSNEFVPTHEEVLAKQAQGSDPMPMVRGALNWYETLGTLHKYALLNENLLFDWLDVASTWNRLKSHALGIRAASGNPRMYENFEAMAEAQGAWAAARESKAA